MRSLTRKIFFLLLPLLSIKYTALSKEAFSWRQLFNRVHFNVSAGGGNNTYEHKIGTASKARAMLFCHKDGNFYILSPTEPDKAYHVHWYEAPYDEVNNVFGNLAQTSENSVAMSTINLTGEGRTCLLSVSCHTDLCRVLRLGVGSTVFRDRIKRLTPTNEGYEQFPPYIFKSENHYRLRPFTIIGFKLFENNTLSVLVTCNAGFDVIYSPSQKKFLEFFKGGTQSIGLTVERHISEYCSVFARGSYEYRDVLHKFCKEPDFDIKTSTSKQLKQHNEKATVVLLKLSSFLLQIGFSLNMPEIPICSVIGCNVERKHKHEGKTYRGASIFKGKDARKRSLFNK